MDLLIGLLIAYQIKHFLCDFPMQTPYMLGKFKDKKWVLPLSTHCLVHALGTAIIVLSSDILDMRIVLILAMFDFVVHFIMDRIKASPKMLGRYSALTKDTFRSATKEQIRSNILFWWSLGLDQMVHHLTHYIIIIVVIMIKYGAH